MNAKRPPAIGDESQPREPLDHLQTRKIDSMSELAADLFLREQDGISGVQVTARQSSPRPPPLASRPPFASRPVRTGVSGVVVAVGLIVALALGFALAAFLLAH